MREKLSTRESLAVYAILVAFTLAVFLFGLYIGMNQAGTVSESGTPSDNLSSVQRSSPKVDFFEQVNKPRPTVGSPTQATDRGIEAPAAGKQPDVLIASGSAPAQPAFPPPGNREEAAAGIPEDTASARNSATTAKPSPISKSTTPATASTPPLTRDEPRATPAVPGEVFTIQIGAVNSEQEARQLVVRLQARGYTGILDRPVGGDRFYRVRVGSYPDRPSAMRAEALLKEEGFPTYIKKVQTGGPAR